MIIPRQYVLLDSSGVLFYSCNSLFDTNFIEPTKILDSFPLIDSIFSTLINLPVGAKKIFEGVNTNQTYLTGIYDFHFFVSSESQGRRFLNWIIEDHTAFYLKMKYLQQQRQNGILAKNKVYSNKKFF